MKDRLAGLGLFLVHPTTRAKYAQMKALAEENQTDLCDRVPRFLHSEKRINLIA